MRPQPIAIQMSATDQMGKFTYALSALQLILEIQVRDGISTY